MAAMNSESRLWFRTPDDVITLLLGAPTGLLPAPKMNDQWRRRTRFVAPLCREGMLGPYG
jgi:hypothetical protein